MRDMVNHDLRLLVKDLVRFANQVHSEVVPPPLGTVFDTPLVPAFNRTLAFCNGGGEVLKMIADVT